MPYKTAESRSLIENEWQEVAIEICSNNAVITQGCSYAKNSSENLAMTTQLTGGKLNRFRFNKVPSPSLLQSLDVWPGVTAFVNPSPASAPNVPSMLVFKVSGQPHISHFTDASIKKDINNQIRSVFLKRRESHKSNFAPIKDFPNQREEIQFQFAADFAPSKTLVEYWKRGIEFYRRLDQDNIENPFVFSKSSKTFDAQIRQEFTELLWGRIIREARRARAKLLTQLILIDSDQLFSPKFEYELSELFPIRPNELSSFLNAASQELYQYFIEGGVKSGNWGSIKIRDNKVSITLSKYENFDEPASTVELLDVPL